MPRRKEDPSVRKGTVITVRMDRHGVNLLEELTKRSRRSKSFWLRRGLSEIYKRLKSFGEEVA